jgi:hypothetical protein
VNVVTVSSLEAAAKFMNVATQTVGVDPPERKAQLRDRLVAAGAQRVVPLGFAMGGPSVPHDGMYQMHRMVKWVVDEGEAANWRAGEGIDPVLAVAAEAAE